MAIATEEEVRAELEAMGLRERLSEEDFILSVRGEVRRRESQGSTQAALGRLSAKLPTRTQTPIAVPEPTYDCEACHDEGYVLTVARAVGEARIVRGNPIPCPRCVPLTDRARAAGVEELFVGARLATLMRRAGNAAAVDFARGWDGSTSVLITSRTQADGETTAGGDSAWGTGKTHLACAMLIGQIERARPGKFLYAKHFLSGIQSLFGAESGAVEAYIQAISATPLLVLDDLGAERPTDWAREQIRTLVDDRYRRKLVTVITTNFGTLERIAEVLGGAVASRLREYQHVKVGGPDMRGMA